MEYLLNAVLQISTDQTLAEVLSVLFAYFLAVYREPVIRKLMPGQLLQMSNY